MAIKGVHSGGNQIGNIPSQDTVPEKTIQNKKDTQVQQTRNKDVFETSSKSADLNTTLNEQGQKVHSMKTEGRLGQNLKPDVKLSSKEDLALKMRHSLSDGVTIKPFTMTRPQTIKVMDGDSLKAVAERLQVDTSKLLQKNDLSLLPGQRLLIQKEFPAAAGESPTSSERALKQIGVSSNAFPNPLGEIADGYIASSPDFGDVDTWHDWLQKMAESQNTLRYPYSTQSGDTLKSIAAKFAVSPESIAESNELKLSAQKIQTS